MKLAIPSGWYMPFTGAVAMLIAAPPPPLPPPSLASRPLPAREWSLRPSGRSAVTAGGPTSEISATALFSWSVTKARVPSGDTAIDSGSKSWAAVAFGPKIRIPWARSAASCPTYAPKPAVCTVADATPPERSITLTEPTGSTLPTWL